MSVPSELWLRCSDPNVCISKWRLAGKISRGFFFPQLPSNFIMRFFRKWQWKLLSENGSWERTENIRRISMLNPPVPFCMLRPFMACFEKLLLQTDSRTYFTEQQMRKALVNGGAINHSRQPACNGGSWCFWKLQCTSRSLSHLSHCPVCCRPPPPISLLPLNMEVSLSYNG